MNERTCLQCEQTKPLTAEYWQRDAKSATGFHTSCKVCRCRYDRQRNTTRARQFQLAASGANHRARKLEIPGELTARDIGLKWINQRGLCYWCSVTLDKFQLDHIHPLGTGFYCGDNSADNICIACVACNQRKSGMPLARWLSVLASQGIEHQLQPDDMPIQRPLILVDRPIRRGRKKWTRYILPMLSKIG